jgi:hypothetical protein
MSIQEFLCGSSAAAFCRAPAKLPGRDDPKTVRFVTRLHLAASRQAPAGFCVVGVCAEGGETLLCLAHTRTEAAERGRAHTGRFAAVRVQSWVGTVRAGRWQTIAVFAREHARSLRRRHQRTGHRNVSC